MLNPNWLITYKTLIDTGHFTQTAELLFMTQPGVSQHIQKLENACGHTLIYRNKKQFELTEQGKLVYQYAKQVVKNESKLLESLAFDDPFSGQYYIASSGAQALVLYPILLSLQIHYSQLVVNMKAMPNQQILDEVHQGQIDLGIVTDISNQHLFDIEKLGGEQLCLVLPQKITSPNIELEQLTDLGLISHPDAEHYLSLYLAQCQEPDLNKITISDLPISGFVNQISQILEPISKGIGFTVLPKSVIDNFHKIENLRVYKPQNTVIEPLYLVKKKNRTLPARFKTVIDALQSHYSSVS